MVSSASVRASVSRRFASALASLRVFSARALAFSTVSAAVRSDSTRRASARCSISLARSCGGAGALLGLADHLLGLRDLGGVPLGLLALGLLPALGELERQGLQVLVALVAGVGEQLGRLGALLLGLAGGLRPLLGDLPLGGGPQGGDLALDGRLQLGDLVRGDRTQLLGLAVGVGAQRVGLAAGLHPDLGGLALGGGAQLAGLALGGRLHRGGLGAGLVGDLAGLEAGGGEDALGLALGLAAVVVGLLLGQPEDLLDAGAEPGEGRPVVLLELLVGVGELLLERAQRCSAWRSRRWASFIRCSASARACSDWFSAAISRPRRSSTCRGRIRAGQR